jgi:NADH/NAD ratio-sensing transcriptional regulator Rex
MPGRRERRVANMMHTISNMTKIQKIIWVGACNLGLALCNYIIQNQNPNAFLSSFAAYSVTPLILIQLTSAGIIESEREMA